MLDYFKSLSIKGWLLWLLVIIPGVPFFFVTLGLMGYIYWPASLDKMVWPAPAHAAEKVTIIAHGLRDTPASWSAPLAAQLKSESGDENSFALDWSAYAQQTFRCSVNGKRIGTALGKRLSQLPELAEVNLIGHSCGAFVIYGLCAALKEKRPEVIVRSSYLDPVAVYGGVFWNYGLGHFGSCADFAAAYIDTEDQVPGSNVPQPQAHTFDVTAARKNSSYTGNPHVWPTLYYPALLQTGWMAADETALALRQRYPVAGLTLLSDPLGL